jgi:ribose transport system ATP-binding protein
MEPFLKIENLTKSFAAVRALKSVQLEVAPGEIHALVGENGAGKSTLIKILMGVYPKDSGTIRVEGAPQEIRSPLQARHLGLAAVYQDVMLARQVSVGENFFMGDLPLKRGVIDWGKVYGETDKFLGELGVTVNARSLVSQLTIAKQQLVAIAKVIWHGAKLVIFDEPTALLTTGETEMLFDIIRRLKAEGKSVLYISHRMEEIFAICDRVTVLKDGCYVATKDIGDTNKDQLISMMVGREVAEAFPARRYHRGEVVLEVKGLSSKNRFREVSFNLHRGEILGFYGLVGAGRSELLRAVFGADPYDTGAIILHGSKVHPKNPMSMIKRGFGLVCEDRKQQSLALPLDVRANINLVRFKENTRFGLIRNRAEEQVTENFIKSLRIRTPSRHQRVMNLSGGNQQKVVIGKWLSIKPEILLFDEPTMGVDVGARIEIYELMQKLVDQGKSIAMISSYLPEVIALSDRILIMREGVAMGIVEHEAAKEETLLRMASGLDAGPDPWPQNDLVDPGPA